MKPAGGQAGGDGERALPLLTAFFLLTALLAGGASSDALTDSATQLIGLPVLCLGLWRLWFSGRQGDMGWPLLLLCGAALLPLTQLIPLPPDLWTSLPGRRIVTDGYIAAQMALPWLPISLTPAYTWDAALALLPPAAMFIAATQATDSVRRLLAWVVVLCALGSIGLAVMQKVGGPDSLFWIYSATRDAPIGLFANRNHQAAFLAASLPLAALLAADFGARSAERGLAAWLALLGYAAVIGVGALVTTSRAGVILAGLGFVGGALVAWRARARPGAARWPILAVAGGGIFALAIAVASLAYGPMAERLTGSWNGELRLHLFPTVAAAGVDFAPTGSGVGSFADIYPMYEHAQDLSPAFVNHAHNDFLEIWLESGVLGVLMTLAFVAWWIAALRDALADSGPSSAMRLAGGVVVWLLLVHSMVDYPLRTMALSTLFAFACALMIPAPDKLSLAMSKT